MRKNYACVSTELTKDECDDEFIIRRVSESLTGIDDPKDFMRYRELTRKDWGYDDCEVELWKGPKYGDRLGFDTTKQIGESYVETHHGLNNRITKYVYELYEIRN